MCLQLGLRVNADQEVTAQSPSCVAAYHFSCFPKPWPKPDQRHSHFRRSSIMAWRGSFSRSFISTARASSFRSSPSPLSSARHVRPPSLQPRRRSFSNPRTFGELGCTHSLMPLHNVMAGARLTSHLAANARACCELYNGTFCRTCQDR